MRIVGHTADQVGEGELMRPNIVRCSAFLALMIVVGCGSDRIVAPKEVAGHTFRAELVNSVPIPFVFSETSTDIHTLTDDKLVFDKSGGLSRYSTFETTAKGTGVKTASTSLRQLSYVINGNNIELTPLTPCPINALCVANDFGTITGTRIYLNSYRLGYPAKVIAFSLDDRPCCSLPH